MKRFEELQVVEIAGSQAGALAAKLFADYGARVVKVEPPGGDPLRPNGEPWAGMGSEFAFFNTSKRSVVLDLQSDAGLRRLAPLIERADVVVESAAPDPLRPLTASLGDEQLVRVYVSPFGLGDPSGPVGPYARYRSNSFTDDAIGGHLWVGGEMDREPLQRRGLHTHVQAGLHAFIGALAALLARERIGRGQTVDVSHQDGMASLHQHTTTMWTHGGHVIERAGNGQAGPWHPAGVYPCRDGYVFLGHATGAKLVPFVEVLGYGHLFEDPRFATDAGRAQHKREFDAALTERLLELTTEEITDLGRAVFSPIGPVPTMLEVLEDEQYRARDFWVCLSPAPEAAPALRFPRGPFWIDGRGADPTLPPPDAAAEGPEDVAADWTPRQPPAGGESLTTGPLDGLRVLDLTRVWAGPIAGRLLGDLGADVIHIEAPWNRGYREADPRMATLGHLFPDNEPGERPWNRIGGFNKLARNKRGLTLNLQEARGRDLFAALVARSDVVLENYSPRVMPQLGFDFAALRTLNPRIVHTAMNGYGASGPGWNRVALGPVIEAAVGLTAMMGYADTGPYRSGVAWADPIAGLAAVSGTLVALWRRGASGGEPQQVETAMSESMAVAAGEELLAAQVRGANAPRIGNRHPVYAPQGVYRCTGHDRWLAISVMTDGEWVALCDVAGIGGDLPALDAAGRRARHDEIDAAISTWTRGQSPGPAMARLQARGVIAAQVSDGRDLVEDPHLAARGFWAELDHADVGPMRYPGNAIRLSETPVTYRVAAPGLGEHNAEILRPLGVTDEELSLLEAEGVITQTPPPAPQE
jgi:crotonobetainyl-CoA:carnitine CoA-transferase CaiB-like acyl-CoA transferase